MKHPILIAIPCFLLDQATKWWVIHNIAYDLEQRTIIRGFFDLVYWGNTGAAFGSFKNHPEFFVILSILTFIGLLIAWARGKFHEPLNRWGVGLLMGGILGNVTDRLWHGQVVDFLLFDLHVPQAHPFPAFNVADSCIFIAVCLFLVASFLEGRAPQRAEDRG